MSKHRFTDDEYAAMADSYADEPVRADEVRFIEVSSAVLRTGRPTKDTESAGKTPPMTIRLPDTIRTEIAHHVEAGESRSESELVRKAVVEYLERHPVRR
jgi:hypothetical protein